MKTIILYCFLICGLFFTAQAQTVVAAKDARKHIGDSVTVTAKVFGGKLFKSSSMVLLDLGGANPNQELTVMIPGPDKEKFKGQPEVDYNGKVITVSGKIVDYKGKPEIVVKDPGQLKVVD